MLKAIALYFSWEKPVLKQKSKIKASRYLFILMEDKGIIVVVNWNLIIIRGKCNFIAFIIKMRVTIIFHKRIGSFFD